ncbi:MAG: hypothetical protein JXB14_07570 [Candidatus Altiarchaeota archaeon]|nr:hypothetical protein [Candidatus Altiarchaeota archaeon]
MPCGRSATRKGRRLSLSADGGDRAHVCYCPTRYGICVCETDEGRVLNKTEHVVAHHDAENYLRVLYEL